MTTTHRPADADYFDLDDDLTAEERDVRDRVRAFATERVQPVINEHWERATFPWELVPGLAELGVVGTVIRGNGCPGMSRRAAGMVAREMARVDGSVNTFLGVHANLCMGAIDVLGDDEQRARLLPALARLERTGAFALTEPEHGSDTVALETRARREGDEWIIDGRKRWIGNGDTADVIVLFARDDADGQVKAFVVERDDARELPPGFRPTVITGKVGKRAILQSDIVVEGLRVPEANRLPGCASFRDVGRVLQATRGGASWEAVGHAMAAYEIARDYAAEREQFGRPIAHYQLVQARLAMMLAEVTAMHLLCVRMSDLADRGTLTNARAAMVKMATSKKGKWVCDEARELLAGNGLLLEHHVARHLTDMAVVSTYEGTHEMQALIVGRDITGVSAFAPRV